ncbi:hypothetical protein [Pyxidicoccus caerfyrddinensis]|uniref:hypothetical protein n=1 Tax=Pyxidicoccus caerfyrddinensis TaxID=2709663 RepID=UPI0013DCA3BA|nr:hypothetical protein [Pyxidicoccus caerfyrddinensis]
MPIDPEHLPVELRELAPAMSLRMPRGGSPSRPPPGVPPGDPSGKTASWVELLFDPGSPALPEPVRARLAAALGSTSVVRIVEYSERSITANKEVAVEQLKARLGPYLASGG